MAENVTNCLMYYLCIEERFEHYLAPLRSLENLKVAKEGSEIWVTNFEPEQFESLEVKTIPNKTLYYKKGNKLFLHGSLLPDRKEPSLLLTPIQRAFPIESLKYNHNYFGVQEKVEIVLKKEEEEKTPFALLTSIDSLTEYVKTAPEFRLNKLKWIVLEDEKALILGTPLLPIKGQVFWEKDHLLLPTGFNLDLSFISQVISNKIDAQNQHWVLWTDNSSFTKIGKEQFKELSLSSLRKTRRSLENMNNLINDVL